MVGYCHGGNVPASHHDPHDHDFRLDHDRDDHNLHNRGHDDKNQRPGITRGPHKAGGKCGLESRRRTVIITIIHYII